MREAKRRKMGYWEPFNVWWREYVAQNDKRPKVHEMRKWYDANAERVWGGTGPTWEETKKHSKGMRRIEDISDYFRQYRKGKRRKAQGCSMGSETSDSDEELMERASTPDSENQTRSQPRPQRKAPAVGCGGRGRGRPPKRDAALDQGVPGPSQDQTVSGSSCQAPSFQHQQQQQPLVSENGAAVDVQMPTSLPYGLQLRPDETDSGMQLQRRRQQQLQNEHLQQQQQQQYQEQQLLLQHVGVPSQFPPMQVAAQQCASSSSLIPQLSNAPQPLRTASTSQIPLAPVPMRGGSAMQLPSVPAPPPAPPRAPQPSMGMASPLPPPQQPQQEGPMQSYLQGQEYQQLSQQQHNHTKLEDPELQPQESARHGQTHAQAQVQHPYYQQQQHHQHFSNHHMQQQHRHQQQQSLSQQQQRQQRQEYDAASPPSEARPAPPPPHYPTIFGMPVSGLPFLGGWVRSRSAGQPHPHVYPPPPPHHPAHGPPPPSYLQRSVTLPRAWPQPPAAPGMPPQPPPPMQRRVAPWGMAITRMLSMPRSLAGPPPPQPMPPPQISPLLSQQPHQERQPQPQAPAQPSQSPFAIRGGTSFFAPFARGGSPQSPPPPHSSPVGPDMDNTAAAAAQPSQPPLAVAELYMIGATAPMYSAGSPQSQESCMSQQQDAPAVVSVGTAASAMQFAMQINRPGANLPQPPLQPPTQMAPASDNNPYVSTMAPPPAPALQPQPLQELPPLQPQPHYPEPQQQHHFHHQQQHPQQQILAPHALQQLQEQELRQPQGQLGSPVPEPQPSKHQHPVPPPLAAPASPANAVDAAASRPLVAPQPQPSQPEGLPAGLPPNPFRTPTRFVSITRHYELLDDPDFRDQLGRTGSPGAAAEDGAGVGFPNDAAGGGGEEAVRAAGGRATAAPDLATILEAGNGSGTAGGCGQAGGALVDGASPRPEVQLGTEQRSGNLVGRLFTRGSTMQRLRELFWSWAASDPDTAANAAATGQDAALATRPYGAGGGSGDAPAAASGDTAIPPRFSVPPLLWARNSLTRSGSPRLQAAPASPPDNGPNPFRQQLQRLGSISSSWLLGKRSREEVTSPSSGTGGSTPTSRKLQRGISGVFRPLVDMVSFGGRRSGTLLCQQHAVAAAEAAVAAVDAERRAEEEAAAVAAAPPAAAEDVALQYGGDKIANGQDPVEVGVAVQQQPAAVANGGAGGMDVEVEAETEGPLLLETLDSHILAAALGEEIAVPAPRQLALQGMLPATALPHATGIPAADGGGAGGGGVLQGFAAQQALQPIAQVEPPPSLMASSVFVAPAAIPPPAAALLSQPPLLQQPPVLPPSTGAQVAGRGTTGGGCHSVLSYQQHPPHLPQPLPLQHRPPNAANAIPRGPVITTGAPGTSGSRAGGAAAAAASQFDDGGYSHHSSQTPSLAPSPQQQQPHQPPLDDVNGNGMLLRLSNSLTDYLKQMVWGGR